MLNLRVNSQPSIFSCRRSAISCVNHDGSVAFGVASTHLTCSSGACIEGLKYLFAAVHPRHQYLKTLKRL